MTTLTVVLIFVVGALLAFPAAILVCAAGGFIIAVVDRLTTVCPRCDQRRMKAVNGIRETYPTGRGTGTFYLCEACSGRWFWSNDDRRFEDAADPRYDQMYKARQGT